MTADNFRDLRAGPVIGAGGVKDSTVRAWIRNNGLVLGDRATREAGNPRYDLADAARLTLMRFLSERLKMQAEPAVATTNAAYDQITELAAAELAAIDDGSAPAGERYIMLIDRVDGLHKPWIGLHDHPWANSARSPILEVRVDLREVVRMARDRLTGELGLPFSALRHDFANAPDGLSAG